jgi:hypothetical protein
MIFDEYIEKKFQSNLELAREELDAVDHLSECTAWKLATEWTEDEIMAEVGKYLSNKWWEKQEVINKAHYG